jgi:peptidoglycan/xylan/chitin deacetylase (PgdA/CDA1 family)
LGNAVALTFDDGPAEWTLPILNTLREAGVPATFFVLGGAIRGREHILERTLDEGHEIGNHSFSHADLPRLPPDRLAAELADSSTAIERVLGRRPTVFRPPYLRWDRGVYRAACATGFDAIVSASVWTDDWMEPSAEAIVSRILGHDCLRPGAIVLLHDGRPPGHPPHGTPRPDGRVSSRDDRLPTVAAVGSIVSALLERGFELVTVSELRGRQYS